MCGKCNGVEPREPWNAGKYAEFGPKPGSHGVHRPPKGDLRCGQALANYNSRPHKPGFENAPGMRPHRPDLA